ncbi:MAG: UDP-2,3-diacylglucosamine diphosphatase [Burkholderiales bacterium]|nr:UDP-2,3-diacylglucosamine diphosphatase [Burkholderiales bacterium]
MSRPLLFASDVHLSVSDPATVEAFVRFVKDIAPQSEALYILGDLFEYWVGDDDEDPLSQEIAAVLAALADQGVHVYLMHGNRDFLIGERFAHAASAQLLTDPYMISAFGQPILLSHGDALCTDDVAYQQFRHMVRTPAWQQAFLARPLADRRAEVARIRAMSEAAKQVKSMDIMDVNQDAVTALLEGWDGANLVHGHTHRPAKHHHTVAGSERIRWVLPDWYAGRGGYLKIDENGPELLGINQDAAWA